MMGSPSLAFEICGGCRGTQTRNSLLTTDQRVPHISLVFREMWDTRIPLGRAHGGAKTVDLAPVASHISGKTSEIWGTLWSVVRRNPKAVAQRRSHAGPIRAVVTLGCKGLRNMWVESQRPQALRRCGRTGYSPMVLPAGTRPQLFGGD